MNKIKWVVLTLSIFAVMTATASANWGVYYNSGDNWSVGFHQDYDGERAMPFAWHDRYEAMRLHYHLERIRDWEWEHRFPGTHIYRFHDIDHGFWHHGHFVTDAVFFYNDNGELVSVGYMADGVFFHFRDDHECYQNHESFYLSWWNR